MIKFFRRIRQQLLTENPPDGRAGKFSKYLLYAIGEIILVVIGILIALQINNWNQNRLTQKKSFEFHMRLAEELETIANRLESDRNIAIQLVEYIGKSVDILEKRRFSEGSTDTINYTLQNFFKYEKIKSKLNTIEEMKSTGQLGLIYNDDLKNKIYKYSSDLERTSQIYEQGSDILNNFEVFDKYVTIKLTGPLQNQIKYNINDLANDKYLINKLSRYGFFWQTKSYFSGELEKSTIELRDAILQELQKGINN